MSDGMIAVNTAEDLTKYRKFFPVKEFDSNSTHAKYI
jgi:hypothetical protein